MTDDAAEAAFFIERLSDRHDRSRFSCGVEQVDNFFRHTAGKLDRAGNTRVMVMLDRDDNIVGFHAVNAHEVSFTELPARFARGAPRHGRIPAAFIAMIGRDARYRGMGIGQHLLVDALLSIERAASEIGMAVVVLDVLDCGNADRVRRRLAIYQQFGFRPFPSNPLRLFLPVKDIRQAQEAAPGPLGSGRQGACPPPFPHEPRPDVPARKWPRCCHRGHRFSGRPQPTSSAPA